MVKLTINKSEYWLLSLLLTSLLLTPYPLGAQTGTTSSSDARPASPVAAALDEPYQSAAITNNPGASIAKKISLEAQVNHREIPGNQLVVLSVNLSWEGKTGNFDINDIPTPELTNLKLVGTSVANETREVNNVFRTTKTYKYSFRPDNPGTALIKAIAISYRDQEGSTFTLATQPFEVKVLPPTVLSRITSSKNRYQTIMTIVIPIFILSSLVFYVVERQRHKAKAFVEVKTEYETLLDDLEKADALRKENKVSEFCTLIAKVFKRALSKRYKFKTCGMTTQDIIKRVSKECGNQPEYLNEISAVLNTCDQVKYNKDALAKEKQDYLYERTKNLVQELGAKFLVNRSTS